MTDAELAKVHHLLRQARNARGLSRGWYNGYLERLGAEAPQLLEEIDRLRALVASLSERCAGQAEALSWRAEKPSA